MAGKQKGSDDMINDINITPMVDIMLVLLIIFMVTASIIVTPSIPVKLPSAATGEETKTKTVSIVITKDNKYFVEGKSIKLDKLEEYLKNKKLSLTNTDVKNKVVPYSPANNKDDIADSNKLATSLPTKLQIVIAADQKAYHGKVMNVVDILRKIGITDYAFSVEDKK